MRIPGAFLNVTALAAMACWFGWPATIGQPPERGPSREEVRRHALTRSQRSLDWAGHSSQTAVARQLKPLDDFFAEAKEHTPQFAASVLGWGSKWRFVADKTPFTRGDRHAEFLQQAFREHLFSPDDLSLAIEQAVESYADSLDEIENRMLVKLRQDLSDLPASELPEFVDEATLSAAYQEAVERTLEHVGSDLNADVTKELLSLVAGEVLTQVAVRLGVSAGILGAGASASWATFGAGLVVGLIVDQLVAWVWNWWADPAGNLAEELRGKLDRLQELIIEGDEATPGLKKSLAEFARRRAELRRAALTELLNGYEPAGS